MGVINQICPGRHWKYAVLLLLYENVWVDMDEQGWFAWYVGASPAKRLNYSQKKKVLYMKIMLQHNP